MANRLSPTSSATSFPIGTRRKGNDGHMWKVVADKNGRVRWAKKSLVENKNNGIKNNKNNSHQRLIKAALKAGQINAANQGKNGSVAWKSFVETHMLTDDIIGTWILDDISHLQRALVILADQIPQESPLWIKMHFITQPYRIRLNNPASLRRILQIAFNWTSAGLPSKHFNHADFIRIE